MVTLTIEVTAVREISPAGRNDVPSKTFYPKRQLHENA